MNVKGKAKIYHNEYQGKHYLSISDSSKNVDGTYTNKYWNVRFPKGVEVPPHESLIEYSGFFTYYKPDQKEKKVYETIMITECNVVKQGNPKDEWDYNDYGVKTEDDLAF